MHDQQIGTGGRVELSGEDVSERVRRKIANLPARPVTVLEAAFRIVGRDDAKITPIRLAPRQRNVGGFGNVKRLAIVEAFDVAELLGMLLEQIGELPDEATALGCGHPAPRPVIKRLASGLHRLIDIFAIAFRDLSENFAGGRIICGKRFSGGGVDPPAVDQHLSWFVDELRDLRMNLRGNCDAHTSSLVNRFASENDAAKRTGLC